jgi:pimeloyl-ACP methyl ester carboxylesterase
VTQFCKTPPLVLLHGYLCDHTLWDGVLSRMPGNLAILAPDLPGFGGAPVLSGEPSIEAMADHVARLLEDRGIARACLAGMSMGGYVALAFAERHRDKLAGLALVSSQAGADAAVPRRWRRSIISSVRNHGAAAAWRALIPKLFSSQRQAAPEASRLAAESAARSSAEGICWAQEAMSRRPDRTEILRTIRIPCLVLHGSADAVIPPERARKEAAALLNVRYIELPGAGHATPWEAPGVVAGAFVDWLDCVGHAELPA